MDNEGGQWNGPGEGGRDPLAFGMGARPPRSPPSACADAEPMRSRMAGAGVGLSFFFPTGTRRCRRHRYGEGKGGTAAGNSAAPVYRYRADTPFDIEPIQSRLVRFMSDTEPVWSQYGADIELI